MRRWAHRTHLTGFLLLAVTACGRGDGPVRPLRISVIDDAGRTVALAGPPRRIVSLSPAATELLFALGAGDRLVGRTTWCDYPPAARQVPSVGDGLNPNIEAVVARHPDLVILYRSALNETAAAQLTRLGIPAALVRQDRLEDIARAAQVLGRLTGADRAGDSLARALQQLSAGKRPRAAPLARVAIVVWDNPPVVIGAGSYLDELADLAGATNVFHDVAEASATVGLETIVARDPELIVVLRDSVTAEPPGFARPEWQAVRAVRAGRILYLTGSLFARPGPRAAEAVAEFRRLLDKAAR